MGCPESQCGAWDAPRAVLHGGMCGMLGGAGDVLGLCRVEECVRCSGLCWGHWGCAVGCSPGVICAALRCVEVPSGRAVEDSVGGLESPVSVRSWDIGWEGLMNWE